MCFTAENMRLILNFKQNITCTIANEAIQSVSVANKRIQLLFHETRLNRTKAQKGRRYLKIFHALYPIKMVSTKIGGNNEKIYILPNLFIGHTLTQIRTSKEKQFGWWKATTQQTFSCIIFKFNMMSNMTLVMIKDKVIQSDTRG